MMRSNNGLVTGVGRSQARLGIGLRTSRPVRQRRLGVCAFKDWFNGLRPQPKESQQEPQAQQGSITAVQEPVAAVPQALQPATKSAPKRDFLEARQVSLFQLFDSSDYKFDIPTYQRPYAWRTKQIYELLQDFVKAYESRQEYFLGAIVATRAADGANVPYQLIDGQQRLTSLVLLLAFLHGWARQQGNEGLEGRIRRMLYLEEDPLDPASSGRYRLRLRDADDAFFRENVLDAFLPHNYRLTGLAAAAEETAAEAEAIGSGAAAIGAMGGDARPLENETWWRLYENASFLRGQLDKLVSEGLNVQDFAFHVLRNCFVVMMVARDEGASFRIFSTLNGRGMDLSVVDKLKADLLAGDLTPAERTHFAGAWAEMESVLGRAAFHRVFDYMRELAAVRDPWVSEMSVLEYFTRRVDDPAAVKQVLQVALDYARLLLQLRQASWATPELAALLAETPAAVQPQDTQEEEMEAGVDGTAVAAAVQAVLEQTAAAAVLAPEEEGRLLERLHQQHRQWQDEGAGAVTVALAAPVVGLEEGPQLEELGAKVELPVAAEASATVAAAAKEVDAVAAAVLSESSSSENHGSPSVLAAAAEADGGVLVFRFDDAPAPSAAPESAAAIAVGADGSEALAIVETAERDAPLEARGDVAGSEAAAANGDLATASSLAVTAAGGSVAAGTREEPPELDGAAAAVELGLGLTQPSGGDSATASASSVTAVEELSESVMSAAASAAAAFEELRAQLREQQQQETEVVVAAAADALVVAAAVAECEPVVVDEQQRQAALLAELDTRSRHLNLFSDEAWLPPLLEFFYQTDDLQARAAFMKGAEALQLLLELQGDPAAKAARWGAVSEALLQRPFQPETVLAALRLTDDERRLFRSRLDSKDLYGTADQRTLRHLLVRGEPPSVSRSLASSGLGGLIVERVVPQSAPEGSTWRKTRILSPCDPRSAWPDTWYTAVAAAAGNSAGSAPASSSSPPSHEQPQATPGDAATAVVPSYEVKYWYEVQRLNWHGKLGNLVLLPATAAGGATATADYDAKAALWRQAGVAARLPGFTGPLVDEQGRYGRFRFCYDECRQRHTDMLEFLISEFEL